MSNPNPLSPDAPILQLLELRHGTLAADMSDEQLAALITKLRGMTQQPQTLSSVVAGEAVKARGTSKAIKVKNILDLI